MDKHYHRDTFDLPWAGPVDQPDCHYGVGLSEPIPPEMAGDWCEPCGAYVVGDDHDYAIEHGD